MLIFWVTGPHTGRIVTHWRYYKQNKDWRGQTYPQPLLLRSEISLFWRTSCARDIFSILLTSLELLKIVYIKESKKTTGFDSTVKISSMGFVFIGTRANETLILCGTLFWYISVSLRVKSNNKNNNKKKIGSEVSTNRNFATCHSAANVMQKLINTHWRACKLRIVKFS